MPESERNPLAPEEKAPVDTQRIRRYRSRSLQLLESALNELRGGRWSRSEDLLWGSLTLAIKGVALSRGRQLQDEEAVRDYATQLGRERRDRRIRDAFSHLSSFADSLERISESRSRVDRLLPALEDIISVVEQLWGMVPRDVEDDRPIEPA